MLVGAGGCGQAHSLGGDVAKLLEGSIPVRFPPNPLCAVRDTEKETEGVIDFLIFTSTTTVTITSPSPPTSSPTHRSRSHERLTCSGYCSFRPPILPTHLHLPPRPLMVTEYQSSDQGWDYNGFHVGDRVFVAKAGCAHPQPAIIVGLLQFSFVEVLYETDGPDAVPTTVQAVELRRTAESSDSDD